jgi:hypothetical protein
LVVGLTVDIPKNPTSGGTVTFEWNSNPTDPYVKANSMCQLPKSKFRDIFSIAIVNPSHNNVFAIANNVETGLGRLTLTLPLLPAA